MGSFVPYHFAEACRRTTAPWSSAVLETGHQDVINSEGFVTRGVLRDHF